MNEMTLTIKVVEDDVGTCVEITGMNGKSPHLMVYAMSEMLRVLSRHTHKLIQEVADDAASCARMQNMAEVERN